MEAIDQLLDLAQISLVLAGFAGVIATFQFNKMGVISRGQVLTLTMILILSFGCLFVSLLPLTLYNFKLTEQTVWMVSNTIGGFVWLVGASFVYNNTRLLKSSSADLFRNWFFIILSLAAGGINFLCAFGVFFESPFGVYFACIMYAYFLICFNFSSLLLRPLWRLTWPVEKSKFKVLSEEDVSSESA
jgi:hypothetical protein